MKHFSGESSIEVDIETLETKFISARKWSETRFLYKGLSHFILLDFSIYLLTDVDK